jgi:hypothetical protein
MGAALEPKEQTITPETVPLSSLQPLARNPHSVFDSALIEDLAAACELCGTLTRRALEVYWHLLNGFQRVIVVVMNGRF